MIEIGFVCESKEQVTRLRECVMEFFEKEYKRVYKPLSK